MKKALILVVLLLAVFIGEILIFDNNTNEEYNKVRILVTSYPLFEITDKLIGSDVEVKKLIPYGVEAHSYMPTAKTMALLTQADLFIYNGLGMETWIKNDYPNAVDMSKHVRLNENSECDEDEHEHHHHDEDADPHYWLDIENMMTMTLVLKQKLEKIFPEHKKTIEKNAVVYIEKLTELSRAYNIGLGGCKRNEIIVNHNAFGYLAKRHDFNVHSVTGLSPDEQVSAKKMKEITDLVIDEKIKVIFFESFVSSKVAEAISKETGARVESLQPLANVTKTEAARGYISIMHDNLEKLSLAMECE